MPETSGQGGLQLESELFRQVQSLPQALASINPYLLIVDHLANIFPQSDTVPLVRGSHPLGSQSRVASNHASAINKKPASTAQSILEAISKLDQHQVTGVSHPALLPTADSSSSASRPSLARCHGCGRTVLSSCCQRHQTVCKLYTGKLAAGIEQGSCKRPRPTVKATPHKPCALAGASAASMQLPTLLPSTTTGCRPATAPSKVPGSKLKEAEPSSQGSAMEGVVQTLSFGEEHRRKRSGTRAKRLCIQPIHEGSEPSSNLQAAALSPGGTGRPTGTGSQESPTGLGSAFAAHVAARHQPSSAARGPAAVPSAHRQPGQPPSRQGPLSARPPDGAGEQRRPAAHPAAAALAGTAPPPMSHASQARAAAGAASQGPGRHPAAAYQHGLAPGSRAAYGPTSLGPGPYSYLAAAQPMQPLVPGVPAASAHAQGSPAPSLRSATAMQYPSLPPQQLQPMPGLQFQQRQQVPGAQVVSQQRQRASSAQLQHAPHPGPTAGQAAHHAAPQAALQSNGYASLGPLPDSAHAPVQPDYRLHHPVAPCMPGAAASAYKDSAGPAGPTTAGFTYPPTLPSHGAALGHPLATPAYSLAKSAMRSHALPPQVVPGSAGATLPAVYAQYGQQHHQLHHQQQQPQQQPTQWPWHAAVGSPGSSSWMQSGSQQPVQRSAQGRQVSNSQSALRMLPQQQLRAAAGMVPQAGQLAALDA